MGKKQIQKSLKIFAARAKRTLVPERVILFGSFVSGQTTEYSDVDILVVAKKFANIPYEERIDVLYDLTRDLYPDFHVYGLTPKEYASASSLTIIEEVKQKGIDLI